MFDDNQSKNSHAPPANLPTEEPVDMFAGIEGGEKEEKPLVSTPDALSRGLLKRKEPPAKEAPGDLGTQAQALDQAPIYDLSKPILGKVLLAMLLVVIVGGLALGGWWLYDRLTRKDKESNNKNTAVIVEIKKTTSSEQQAIVVSKIETTTAKATSTTDMSNRINNDNILFGEAIDTDKDGLDDIREKQLGTDIFKIDTDNDGLSDGDEVLVWKTNPLQADTDGDSYLDGHEVKNGYNPAGPGKLFNLPKSSTTTVKSTSTK